MGAIDIDPAPPTHGGHFYWLGPLHMGAIDIDLADGTGGSFYLPNINNADASSGSGGLEMRQGMASIEGDDIGLFLDGFIT